jgi:hypothetical protein
VALSETDCRVAYPLQLIRRIYRLEDLADVKHLEPDERAALRGERSQAALDKLKRWLLFTTLSEPPSTELARAAGYCLNHWNALVRFVGDGRLSLDNNVCEQQLRDIALGRRNFLFAGSHDAARRSAALYQLDAHVRSARRSTVAVSHGRAAQAGPRLGRDPVRPAAAGSLATAAQRRSTCGRPIRSAPRNRQASPGHGLRPPALPAGGSPTLPATRYAAHAAITAAHGMAGRLPLKRRRGVHP